MAMPGKTPTDTLLAVIKNLTHLFSIPLRQMGDAVLTGSAHSAARHRKEFPGDPIGLEATVNHYHLEDHIQGPRLKPRAQRQLLMTLAEALMRVWSERLVRFLGDRAAIFYLGGADTVVIRFHVERPGTEPWTTLTRAFMKQERLRVYRSAGGVVERIL
jgi:hypothetical protein